MLKWHEGDVIRKLRSDCGLTLQELAGLAGVSFTTINRIELAETKEPKRSTLLSLSQVFGIKPSELAEAIPLATITINPIDRVEEIRAAKQGKKELANLDRRTAVKNTKKRRGRLANG